MLYNNDDDGLMDVPCCSLHSVDMLYEPTVIHFHEALLRLVHVYILGLRPVSEKTVHTGSFKPPYAVAISLATVLKPAEMRKKSSGF